jgi:putative acetyltransferase
MLPATPSAGSNALNSSEVTTSEIHIRSFQPEDALAFRQLNEEWITNFFTLEERDRQTLGDPETHILQPGGHIFMACLDSLAVGCCALIPFSPGVFELSWTLPILDVPLRANGQAR